MADYRSVPYAMLPFDALTVGNGDQIKGIQMLVDDPVKHLTIKSMDFHNRESCLVQYSDGSEGQLILSEYIDDYDSVQPGDTLLLERELENRLEKYRHESYSFILPEISDTLSPSIVEHGFKDYRYFVSFSEPVRNTEIDDLSHPFFTLAVEDSTTYRFLSYIVDDYTFYVADIATEPRSFQLKSAIIVYTLGAFSRMP